MNTELLNNNLEIASNTEETALDIMNSMFGEEIVEQANSLSTVWSAAIVEVDWGKVGISAGIGAVAGFTIGILLAKINNLMQTQGAYKDIDPDPAHGCSCQVVSVATVGGAIAGALVGYYTQIR